MHGWPPCVMQKLRGNVTTDTSRREPAVSFGGSAREYDRFRPQPPPEALDWLVPKEAVSIAEIGAGTGLLTRHLIGPARRVFAIEPDPRMREVLHEKVPSVLALAGRGEAIPLSGVSMDLVIAATSWHWVDQKEGFAEAARVLRRGGTLALLWTGPDRSIDWVSHLMAGGGTASAEERQQTVQETRRRNRPEMPEGAPFSDPETRVFRGSWSLTAEELIGLPATFSQVLTLTPAQRVEYDDQLRRFVTDEIVLSDGRAELPIGCTTWRAVRL
jgi:SAM-dependent methyltransferase